jgi:hypothetical protein
MQSVSTTKSVSAPGPGIATLWSITTGTTSSGNTVGGVGCTRDLVGSYGGGTLATMGPSPNTLVVACSPPMPAGVSMTAGTATLNIWFSNTTNKTCPETGNLIAGASTNLGSITGPTIPANTPTPTKYTVNVPVIARSFPTGERMGWFMNIRPNNNCTGVTLHYNSAGNAATVSIPTMTGGGTPLPTPNAPTGLTVTANGDGTRTLTWNAPASGIGVDQYRIYRDGTGTAARVDSEGAAVTPVSWTDFATGGTSHTYRVTSVSSAMVESSFLGPVTG